MGLLSNLKILPVLEGALFVLEIPHRMGLQYFEALSPATIASIVAVLCNRLVTNNDVTGTQFVRYNHDGKNSNTIFHNWFQMLHTAGYYR